VSRRDAVQRAETGDVLDGQRVARKVQPAVKEHAAVAGGKDEAVAVEPLGFVGVVAQGMTVEHGANFRGAEGQTQVARFAFGDSVHRQPPRVAGGQFQRGDIETHIFVPEKSACTPPWQVWG
jgi:hypothetical protein